jgi:hypothetical protein
MIGAAHKRVAIKNNLIVVFKFEKLRFEKLEYLCQK